MVTVALFDLDGTMLPSDDLHVEVFRDFLGEHGVTLGDGDYQRHILGRTNAEIFGHFLPGQDWRPLDAEKEARFRARLGTSAAPTLGLESFLDRLAARRVRLGVVTNAPRANADAMLSAIGAVGRFEVVIASGDAPRGKPAPDPYLAGLAALGAAAGEAIAFEDSRPGIAAARAAGIRTVGLTTSLTAEDLIAAGADLTIPDFTDPALSRELDRLTGAAA